LSPIVATMSRWRQTLSLITSRSVRMTAVSDQGPGSCHRVTFSRSSRTYRIDKPVGLTGLYLRWCPCPSAKHQQEVHQRKSTFLSLQPAGSCRISPGRVSWSPPCRCLLWIANHWQAACSNPAQFTCLCGEFSSPSFCLELRIEQFISQQATMDAKVRWNPQSRSAWAGS